METKITNLHMAVDELIRLKHILVGLKHYEQAGDLREVERYLATISNHPISQQ